MGPDLPHRLGLTTAELAARVGFTNDGSMRNIKTATMRPR
jgi:hypothetical protein